MLNLSYMSFSFKEIAWLLLTVVPIKQSVRTRAQIKRQIMGLFRCWDFLRIAFPNANSR